MAIIATICLLVAGMILSMAAAKHEYGRQCLRAEQADKKETHAQQKDNERPLLEIVLFLLSAIVMTASGLFWVAWEFFLNSTLEGYGHAMFCLIWVISSYCTGAKTGKALGHLRKPHF